MVEYSAGIVTAYGSAKRAGYTGTYEDFCRQQAQYAQNASAVEQAKQTAVSASQSADQAKQDAMTASTTAQQSAQTAQGSAQSAGQSAVDAQTAKNNAQTYAQSASQSAGSAQQSAQSAQAVLESIPEDYSDLSSDVVQLKADLGDLTDLETENKNSIVSAINEVAGGGLSDEVKNSLLLCLRNVPYLSDNGAYELLSAALDGESDYRFITLDDIESSVGYGNISVNNGTVTPETFVSFSILTYNVDSIRFTTPEVYAPGRFVFKKSGTNYYVVSGGGVIMRFDKSGSKYTAVQNIDQTFATITKYNGFNSVAKGKRYQIELDNGIFRLSSGSGEKLMEITNADIIGYWGDNIENLGKIWRFENARVLNGD